jgi:CubicO group peptidase (beta-lactamase class C family)
MIDNVVQNKVDALFSSFNKPGTPGCALGLMKDGDLVYKQGYGLANLEHNVAISPSTTFYIASLAKQFTGLAVALLASQGKIDLDTNIRTYLPHTPDFGHTMSVQHLLYHTSGLRSDIFLLMLAGWRIEDVITQEDVIELFKNQRELDFAPGEEFSYCGTGYSLLAEIVSAASGQRFPEFCADHMFAPLGMINTHFESDPMALIPGRADAYLAVGESEYKKAVLTISILGGTGLYTTIEDLALWDENFYTGRVGGPAAFEMMQTPGVLNSGEALSYAFGLSIGQHLGRKTLSHGGDSSGIHCYMLRFPDEHLSIAILGNVSTLRASALAHDVADIVLESADKSEEPIPDTPAEPTIIDLSLEFLESRSGRYFDTKSAAFVDLLLKEAKLSVYGYELSATSEDAFFFTQHPEATVLFSHGETDTLSVTIDIGNGPSSYKKVHPIAPSAEDLAAFVGSYRSAELDVVWHVSSDNEKLSIHRRRHGESVLTSVCQDVFVDPWIGDIMHGKAQWVIAFDRTSGCVSGLRVTAAGGRGRNLRFDKVE